jgi:hypothetical protein
MPVHDIIQEKKKAAIRPALSHIPALFSPINLLELIRKRIAPITSGSTKTLATCVVIWAIIGLVPIIGTIRPMTQDKAVRTLN